VSDFTSHMRRFCPRVSRRVALPQPTWVFPHGPHGFWRYAGWFSMGAELTATMALATSNLAAPRGIHWAAKHPDLPF
jgi:hypothetical protein